MEKFETYISNYCTLSKVPYFFGYKTHPNFSMQFFQVDKLKIKPKLIPSYMAQPRFSAIFTLTTTTRFSTRLITAIHLREQKRKRLHISIKESLIEIFKRKKSDLSTQKPLFSKAMNTQGILLVHKPASCFGCSILTLVHSLVVSR